MTPYGLEKDYGEALPHLWAPVTAINWYGPLDHQEDLAQQQSHPKRPVPLNQNSAGEETVLLSGWTVTQTEWSEQ